MAYYILKNVPNKILEAEISLNGLLSSYQTVESFSNLINEKIKLNIRLV